MNRGGDISSVDESVTRVDVGSGRGESEAERVNGLREIAGKS